MKDGHSPALLLTYLAVEPKALQTFGFCSICNGLKVDRFPKVSSDQATEERQRQCRER